MSQLNTQLPQWLQSATHDEDYLDNIVWELAERENQRNRARNASRMCAVHQTDVSALPYPQYSIAVGCSTEHRMDNRYSNVEPYDRTRVTVSGQYLNASWVRELHGKRWWIASQAPLPSTSHTFLSLLLQEQTWPPPSLDPISAKATGPCRIRTVVQLTQSKENGRIKAHPYFPTEVGHSFLIPSPNGSEHISIKLLDAVAMENASCVKSTLALSVGNPQTNTTPPVVFNHLLYRSWPDFGVPNGEDRDSFIRFLSLVPQINRDVSSQTPGVHPDPPIVIGCSAGIGRTGTFIAISSLLRTRGFWGGVGRLKDQPPLPPSPLPPPTAAIAEDDAAQEVDSLREQRPGMVQSDEQLAFIYTAIGHVLSSTQ